MCVQFMISSYQFDGAYRRPMDAILYSASVFICRQRVGWRREQAEGRSCRRILEVHILTRRSPWGKDLFSSVFDLVTFNPVLPLCYTGSSLSLPLLHIRTRRSRVGEPVKQKNILRSSFFSPPGPDALRSWKREGFCTQLNCTPANQDCDLNHEETKNFDVFCWWCLTSPDSSMWHQRQSSSRRRRRRQSCWWSRCRWWRWNNRSLLSANGDFCLAWRR